MRKFFISNLIWLVAWELIFPNGLGAVAQAADFRPAGSNAAENSSVQIVVVSAQPTAHIVAAANRFAAWGAKCFSPLPQPQNLAQDTGVINLNQPADCFDLVLGKIAVQAKLAVAHPFASPPIRIVAPPSAIVSSNLSAAPESPSIPILPVLSLGLVWMLYEPIQKSRRALKRRLYQNLRQTALTLPQLQILRC